MSRISAIWLCLVFALGLAGGYAAAAHYLYPETDYFAEPEEATPVAHTPALRHTLIASEVAVCHDVVVVEVHADLPPRIPAATDD